MTAALPARLSLAEAVDRFERRVRRTAISLAKELDEALEELRASLLPSSIPDPDEDDWDLEHRRVRLRIHKQRSAARKKRK